MKWTFLKSVNFWTGIITVLIAILYVWFGPEAANLEDPLNELKDSIFTGDLTASIVAFANLANIAYHIFFKKD